MLSVDKILEIRDPHERLKQSIYRRYCLLDMARSDEVRTAIKNHCKTNPVDFINDWCWTYDPRNPSDGLPAVIPFHLFPVQRDLVYWIQECIQDKANGLIEKSRDMGATWVFSGFDVHQWLFTNGFKGGIGSRKLQLVDRKGDPDAIFYKLRFIINHLPKWFLPDSYDPRKHDNIGKLQNPETGAVITGEGGDEIGRGGRSTCYLIDEHASLQRAEMVDQAVSQNTNTVFYLSTPKGTGNLFARKRFEGKTRIFTLHWKDHPWKDEVWYKAQQAKYNAVLIAQEVDIDYTASVEGVCIPAKYVQAAVALDIPKGHRRVAGLDVADGSDENVYILREGTVFSKLECWVEGNVTQTAWRAKDRSERDKIEALHFDRDGPGAGIYGPYQTLEDEGTPLSFQTLGVRSGGPPSDKRYPDAPAVPSDERFRNLKMEMWWNARLYFERTWEHVNGVQTHPPEQLISIPNDPTLIAQLSQPTIFYTSDGKMILESKKQLKARGVGSPDRAESLILALSEPYSNFLGAFVS